MREVTNLASIDVGSVGEAGGVVAFRIRFGLSGVRERIFPEVLTIVFTMYMQD